VALSAFTSKEKNRKTMRTAFYSAGKRLTEAIFEDPGAVELVETLKEIAVEIGVRHIAQLRFASDKSPDTSLLTAVVTYSREWQARYFIKQYILIDPVVTFGRTAVCPFDWQDLSFSEPAAVVFADAEKFGVGRNGLSIPIRTRPNVISLVSFSSDLPRGEWEEYKLNYMADLLLLSLLIDSAARLGGKLQPLSTTLSRREEQCLIWAARGKTYHEIAEILDLTFGSVKTYLDTARHKLRCMNLTHAAAFAVATGVIPPTVLQRSDRDWQREPPFEPSAEQRPILAAEAARRGAIL